MLARRHAIAVHDFALGRIFPDRLTTSRHRRYRELAERMLQVYRDGRGQTRRALHQAIGRLLGDEPDCPQRRIDSFCKLLDEVAEFRRYGSVEAAALRRSVFLASAASHPLVDAPDAIFRHTRREVTRRLAQKLERPWYEIERDLFADVWEFHRLEHFAGYPDGPALLSRYNVAQQQAALFDAISMTVDAGRDFKIILRYAKLAGLMHTVLRAADGRYHFHFDGPVSALRKTSRYGAAMARFLPALIACRDWTMQAVIKRRRAPPLNLQLSSEDKLSSPFPPPAEFDSRVEARFAAEWGDGPRDGWTLHREGEVLCRDQRVFIPDFTLRHRDGRCVLFEIIGYWTPEYLQKKLATLRFFSEARILLAIVRQHGAVAAQLPSETIVYKSAIRVDDVLDRVRRFARPDGGDPQQV
jgi:uncharacterized protein